MDFIMDSRLIYCLQHGLPLDMDVYDLAEWCCLAELGELSMDNHGAPVAIPDFTRGNGITLRDTHMHLHHLKKKRSRRKIFDFYQTIEGKREKDLEFSIEY